MNTLCTCGHSKKKHDDGVCFEIIGRTGDDQDNEIYCACIAFRASCLCDGFQVEECFCECAEDKVSEKHDWREDVREKVLPFGLWHDHPSGYEQRISHIINFITEVETEAYTKGFDMALMGQEMAKRETRRTTIDTIIKLIKEHGEVETN